MALILPNTIANGVVADGDKLNQNLQAVVTWANTEAISRDGSTAMTGPLLLPGPPTLANQAATKGYIDNNPVPGPPIGSMCQWHYYYNSTTGVYVTPPVLLPWMNCQGQLLSRSTYSVLFGVIGTAYGAGDGTSTFNLPSNGNIIKVL